MGRHVPRRPPRVWAWSLARSRAQSIATSAAVEAVSWMEPFHSSERPHSWRSQSQHASSSSVSAGADCPGPIAGAVPVMVAIEQSYAANAVVSLPQSRTYLDALGRTLRDELAEACPEILGEYAAALGAERARLKRECPDPARRARALDHLARRETRDRLLCGTAGTLEARLREETGRFLGEDTPPARP